MDGTEALDGTQPSTPPPIDSSLTGDPNGQAGAGQNEQDASGSQQGTTQQPNQQSQAQAAQSAPAAAPAAPPKPKTLGGVLDSILDMLSPSATSSTVFDANGQRQNVPGPTLTRGQQVGNLIGTALRGAAAGASAPAGPAHISQGFANGVQGEEAHEAASAQQKEAQAEGDFQRMQKAKQDNLNYQLGQRTLAAATFANTRMGVKANQEDIGFAQAQDAREEQLGSFQLGTFQGARDIHQVMDAQPDFLKKLNQQLIVSVPQYNGDGTYAGLKVYERKPNVGAQPATKGTQFATFEPPSKPGAQPSYTWHTAADGQYSNDDITRFNNAAMNASTQYTSQQAELALKGAETKKTNAEAAEAPSLINKNNAEAVQARAAATKDYAEARKTKIDADNASGGDGSTGNLAQDAHMMVDGLASPEQFSKRSKDYNAMLPEANRYSLQKYGVPFDGEISQGRYLARRDTIKAFGSGKEGDQIQTFNQFVAHAGDLSGAIDQLRNTNVALLNTPLKDLRKSMNATQYAAIEPMIAAVRTEHSNFLNNNHALHDEDVKDGADMLNDTQTLGQSQAAIKAFMHTALARAGALNQRYRRVVGTGDVPDLLDPYSRKVISGLGLDSEAQGALGTAWSQPKTTPQNATTPPQPNSQQQPQVQQPQQQVQPQAQGIKAPARPAGIPPDYAFIQDSKGGQHWIPRGNLPAAQKLDPHLQVGQ